MAKRKKKYAVQRGKRTRATNSLRKACAMIGSSMKAKLLLRTSNGELLLSRRRDPATGKPWVCKELG